MIVVNFVLITTQLRDSIRINAALLNYINNKYTIFFFFFFKLTIYTDKYYLVKELDAVPGEATLKLHVDEAEIDNGISTELGEVFPLKALFPFELELNMSSLIVANESADPGVILGSSSMFFT